MLPPHSLDGARPASLTELHAVRDDLQRIVADLTRVEARHRQAIQRVEDDAKETKTRIDTLEAQVAFLVSEVLELKQQGYPSGARNGAVVGKASKSPSPAHRSPSRRTEPRKLLLAGPGSVHSSSPEERKMQLKAAPRKSYASLAVERQSSESPEPSAALASARRKSKGKERAAPGDESDGSIHAESKHTSKSRVVTPIKLAQPRAVDAPSPSRLNGVSKPNGTAAGPSTSENARPVDDSDDDMEAVSEDSESSTDDEITVWQFECEGVPRAALKKTEGPLLREELEELLQMEPDTLEVIDKLITVKKPRFRACLYQDLAFIYDPHMLEAGPYSAFVGWSTPKYDHWMKTYVHSHGAAHGTCFHTFAHPRQPEVKGWWYLGYLEWTQLNTEPLWAQIGPDEKRFLTKTLAESWDCGFRPSEIAAQLDNRELVQYAIHVSRPEDFAAKTKQFIEEDLQNPGSRGDEDDLQ